MAHDVLLSSVREGFGNPANLPALAKWPPREMRDRSLKPRSALTPLRGGPGD